MTVYCYDTEFLEDGHTIDLISAQLSRAGIEGTFVGLRRWGMAS